MTHETPPHASNEGSFYPVWEGSPVTADIVAQQRADEQAGRLDPFRRKALIGAFGVLGLVAGLETMNVGNQLATNGIDLGSGKLMADVGLLVTMGVGLGGLHRAIWGARPSAETTQST